MNNYVKNKRCRCMRCVTGDMMGPVLLITVGVLLLLDNVSHINFHNTWPLLLIVVGSVRVLQSSASTDQHVQPWEMPGVVAPPPPVPPQEPGTGSQEAYHG
jgi:hypothetical protein